MFSIMYLFVPESVNFMKYWVSKSNVAPVIRTVGVTPEYPTFVNDP